LSSLKIYKSSAGSGKTFTLVLEYLKLVLRNPEDYKSILAITFTNKAAGEMKDRIIDALVSLAKNEDSSLKKILENELPEVKLLKNSERVLKSILHDYSAFSVSTIDSFFQKVLRALAREIHLPLNLQVEVDHDDAILDATYRLLKDVGIDNDLTGWLTELALQKMNSDKGWNLDKDIITVAKEIFKEDKQNAEFLSREKINHHYKLLLERKRSFESKMKDFGNEGLLIIQSTGLEITDFLFGKSGVANYFHKIASGNGPDSYASGSRVSEAINDPKKWTKKDSPNKDEIIHLAETALIPLLSKIISYKDINYRNYLTSVEVIRNIYLFGIINDLNKKFSEYRKDNNVILLSDTTRLLSELISENDAPFIYEKTGNRYKHLLIDEFQDTSLLQWKNLLPLIINALGSGFNTLIVGDAKQSIYRWRGGNMNLLLKDLFSDLKNFKSLIKEEVLSVNYRSKNEIVQFNNRFFSSAPSIANNKLGMNNFLHLELAYGKDLRQKTVLKNENGGYVKVNFIESETDEEGDPIHWKDSAKKALLETINNSLKNNFNLRDICILVRKNNEGNEIANYLFENGIEDIISPDSLLLKSSPKICFLLSTLRFLADTSDLISESEVVYYYNRYISENKVENLQEVFLNKSFAASPSERSTKNNSSKSFERSIFKYLPDEFTAHLSYLHKQPVYELCEQLLSIFRLNDIPDAYIQRFQDLVLEYSIRENSSLEGFIEWWDSNKKVENCSVVTPENMNAIRIMTIHRSKGLQFPVVIMPFTEWKLTPKANSLIWLNTTESPYDQLGDVAFFASKKLMETFYSDGYAYEANQTVIDNLNMLYVAFTRAEEKLFITCPKVKSKEMNSVSKLIFNVCTDLEQDFNGIIFEKGIDGPQLKNKAEGNIDAAISLLRNYPINRWQEKLSLTTHSTDIISLIDNSGISKINYGILVHEILAGIRFIKDIDIAIDKVLFKGLIGNDEKLELKREIEDVLSVPEIRELFDVRYSSITEKNILLRDGSNLRPDRVIVFENTMTVIDFKTGKRDTKHIEQINTYCNILRSMNYKNVTGKIVYLAERSILSL
jgi:ATP-dependent exoDNAse (exonuclease V) beta subunit